MRVTSSVRIGLALLACGVLGACAGTTDGGDCVSHYDSIASAPTWHDLEDAMLQSTEWGQVASVRTQARGQDVGAGDHAAVRVVDLLSEDGRRLVQADVWRTDAGAWSAGVWNQCTD